MNRQQSDQALADAPAQSVSVRVLAPEGIDPAWYALGLAGPLALGLAVGLQLMLIGLTLFGPVVRSPEFMARLTLHGQMLIRPERDILLYVAGAALTLALMLGFAAAWTLLLRRLPRERRQSFFIVSAALQLVLSLASSLLFYCVFSSRCPISGATGLRTPVGGLGAFVLLIPPVMACACAAADLLMSLVQKEKPRIQAALRCARWTLDLAVPLLLVFVLYVPRSQWAALAGRFYVEERLHHWCYYAMAPALAFAHGKTFFVDFSSQYGMGWPLLFAMGWERPLTFASMVGTAVIYCCLYYVGLYGLLRAVFRDAVWAASGTLLAVMLQIYSGLLDLRLNWTYPSSTMMRHPADVWCFLAILAHARGGRTAWMILAGAACGVGMVFGTDTGLYLLAAMLIYCAITLLIEWPHGAARAIRRASAAAGTSLAAALAPLVAAAFTASHGQVPTMAFWRGWLASLHTYVIDGMGMLPLGEVDDAGVLLFALMVGTYCVAIAVGAGAVAFRASRRAETTVLAVIACYGLAQLLLFVGRSHPLNLYHAGVPLAIVATGLLWLLRASVRRLQCTTIPTAILAVIVVLLVTKPEFLDAPTLARSVLSPATRPGLRLAHNDLEVTGLPQQQAEDLRNELHDVSRIIRELSAKGGQVAVLDTHETVFYAVADVCPWSRTPWPLYAMQTVDMVAKIRTELVRQQPRYVMLRDTGELLDPVIRPNLLALSETVHEHYKRVGSFAYYGIWELKSSAGSPPAPGAPK